MFGEQYHIWICRSTDNEKVHMAPKEKRLLFTMSKSDSREHDPKSRMLCFPFYLSFCFTDTDLQIAEGDGSLFQNDPLTAPASRRSPKPSEAQRLQESASEPVSSANVSRSNLEYNVTILLFDISLSYLQNS